MVEMKTEMQMEGGVTVSMKADKRALDVVVAFREKDGTESERLPFWLNAKEAEALGNALIAMAHASMTYGVTYE